MTAADEKNPSPRVLLAFRTQEVLQGVGDLPTELPFAQSRDVAIAHPVMVAVGSGTIDHDIRLGNLFCPLSHEQKTKRITLPGTTDQIFLANAVSPDVQHFDSLSNALPQRLAFGQRPEISLHVLSSRQVVARRGERSAGFPKRLRSEVGVVELPG